MIRALKIWRNSFFDWMSWIPTSKFLEQATRAMETRQLSSYFIDGIEFLSQAVAHLKFWIFFTTFEGVGSRKF